MKIDKEEFVKQNKEEILKSGKYMKAEVIVGRDNSVPYSSVEGFECNSETAIVLILSLESLIEDLKKDFPEYKYWKNMFKKTRIADIKKIDSENRKC